MGERGVGASRWRLGNEARRLLGSVLVGLLLGSASSVSAQPVDDATRAASREAGIEGLEAYDAGDYEKAAARLGAAYNTVRVPTLGLWLARALAKTGRLVEAAERYREVGRLTIQPGQHEQAQRRAKADAKKELEELKPRVPFLLIRIEGAEPNDVRVTIDGAALPPTLVNGLARPTNPGKRVVCGVLGARVVTEEVDLAEKERRTVVLDFTPLPTPTHESAPATIEPELPLPPRIDEKQTSPSRQRTAGWIVLGAGGVGLVLAGTSALIATSLENSISDDCSESNCNSGTRNTVKAHNTWVDTSAISFWTGSALALSGIGLMLTAPKRGLQKDESHRIWLTISSQGIDLQGSL